MWVKRFDGLSRALEDLVNGTRRFQRPQYRNLEGEKLGEIQEGAPQLSGGNGFGHARLESEQLPERGVCGVRSWRQVSGATGPAPGDR